MPGKLPIDRARLRTSAARPYDEHKQTLRMHQAEQERSSREPEGANAGDGHEGEQEDRGA